MNVDVQSIVILIIIGAIAGWLAGIIMRGGGFGILVNIIVGIIGAVLGGWLVGGMIPPIVALGPITLGAILTALVGAIILLFILSLIKK